MKTLNGPAVLVSIGRNTEVFAGVRPDIDKFALTTIAKVLKKAMTTSELAALAAAVGGELPIILEHMSGNDLKAIVKRLDKHNSPILAADAHSLRGHIRELAAGKPLAAPPPKKTPAKKAPAAAKKVAGVTADDPFPSAFSINTRKR